MKNETCGCSVLEYFKYATGTLSECDALFNGGLATTLPVLNPDFPTPNEFNEDVLNGMPWLKPEQSNFTTWLYELGKVAVQLKKLQQLDAAAESLEERAGFSGPRAMLELARDKMKNVVFVDSTKLQVGQKDKLLKTLSKENCGKNMKAYADQNPKVQKQYDAAKKAGFEACMEHIKLNGNPVKITLKGKACMARLGEASKFDKLKKLPKGHPCRGKEMEFKRKMENGNNHKGTGGRGRRRRKPRRLGEADASFSFEREKGKKQIKKRAAKEEERKTKGRHVHTGTLRSTR